MLATAKQSISHGSKTGTGPVSSGCAPHSCVPHTVVSVVVGWARMAIMAWFVEGLRVGYYATMQQIPSFGVASLRLESQVHESLQVSLLKTAGDQTVLPWPLG